MKKPQRTTNLSTRVTPEMQKEFYQKVENECPETAPATVLRQLVSLYLSNRIKLS